MLRIIACREYLMLFRELSNNKRSPLFLYTFFSEKCGLFFLQSIKNFIVHFYFLLLFNTNFRTLLKNVHKKNYAISIKEIRIKVMSFRLFCYITA